MVEQTLAILVATTFKSTKLMRHLLDMSMSNRLEAKKSTTMMQSVTFAM